jgi:hypothetical protein
MEPFFFLFIREKAPIGAFPLDRDLALFYLARVSATATVSTFTVSQHALESTVTVETADESATIGSSVVAGLVQATIERALMINTAFFTSLDFFESNESICSREKIQ